jgi:hypothetical protein
MNYKNPTLKTMMKNLRIECFVKHYGKRAALKGKSRTFTGGKLLLCK